MDIIDLVCRIRHMISFGLSLEDIRTKMLAETTMDDGLFFLAYKAAELA